MRYGGHFRRNECSPSIDRRDHRPTQDGLQGIFAPYGQLPLLDGPAALGADRALLDRPLQAVHGLAGVLLAVAAGAMTWIKEPPIVRDVDALLAMPAGAH